MATGPTAYLFSVPERVIRSLSALTGGLLREIGELALPARVRRTRLYQTMVDSTLRFLIEQVGEVEGVYPAGSELAKDFVIRRTAGNVLEVAGIVAFRASPVWVLAALADLSGAGRDLLADIVATLQKEGLLEPGATLESVDALLDGLERTAGRFAETVNTPPLDAASLRQELAKLRQDASSIPRASVPSIAALREQWQELKREAAVQGRSVFELSSAMAVSAIRSLPDNARWLSQTAQVTGRHTGSMLARALLDHYRDTLTEIHKTGYARYWNREFGPYLAGALRQLSPKRTSLTERFLIARRRHRR
jgi:hypothetical protein